MGNFKDNSLGLNYMIDGKNGLRGSSDSLN